MKKIKGIIGMSVVGSVLLGTFGMLLYTLYLEFGVVAPLSVIVAVGIFVTGLVWMVDYLDP